MQAARGAPLTPPGEPGQPDPDDPGTSPRPTRRRVGALLAVAVFVLAVDIATKVTIVATLSNRPPLVLLGGFLTLRVSRNPGAAFSIGPSMTVLFTAIAVGVIVFVLRTSRQIRSLPWAVTLGLLLGGAMGNLTDRLLRSPGPLRGWVVDWIQVPHWPVFNLADSSIVCGGILAVLLAARGLRIDGTRHGQDSQGGSGGGQQGGGQQGGGQQGGSPPASGGDAGGDAQASNGQQAADGPPIGGERV
ncbi:MAG TPA: signal peptidase II [Streptosporangiaceae bacterium]